MWGKECETFSCLKPIGPSWTVNRFHEQTNFCILIAQPHPKQSVVSTGLPKIPVDRPKLSCQKISWQRDTNFHSYSTWRNRDLRFSPVGISMQSCLLGHTILSAYYRKNWEVMSGRKICISVNRQHRQNRRENTPSDLEATRAPLWPDYWQLRGRFPPSSSVNGNQSKWWSALLFEPIFRGR